MGADGRLFGKMFNLGVRAPDLDSERDFLALFKPDRMETIRRTAAFGPSEVTAVHFGPLLLFLFDKPVYDDRLQSEGIPSAGGIAHVSLMVQSTDHVLAAAAAGGVEPLLGPYEVTPEGHGRRKVAFFASPNGTILESQELLDG